MNHPVQRAAPAVALGLALLASAHAEGSAPARPAAGDPLHYHSAFADYKPWQDTGPGDWRALNDAVKDSSTAGMDMPGMHDMGTMKGMSGPPGHDGSLPAASPPAHAGHRHAPAKAASTPAHAGHDVPGGRP